MSCPVPEQKRKDIKTVTSLSKGSETNTRSPQPGVIEFYTTARYNTPSILYGQSQKAIKRVKAWAETKYGKEFSDLWVETIYQGSPEYVRVAFRFPSRLEKVLLIEEEQLTLEEANAQILREVGNDFFMNDPALEFQQEREYKEMSTITDEQLDDLRKRKPDC
jgi:hypothetical protein